MLLLLPHNCCVYPVTLARCTSSIILYFTYDMKHESIFGSINKDIAVQVQYAFALKMCSGHTGWESTPACEARLMKSVSQRSTYIIPYICCSYKGDKKPYQQIISCRSKFMGAYSERAGEGGSNKCHTLPLVLSAQISTKTSIEIGKYAIAPTCRSRESYCMIYALTLRIKTNKTRCIPTRRSNETRG